DFPRRHGALFHDSMSHNRRNSVRVCRVSITGFSISFPVSRLAVQDVRPSGAQHRRGDRPTCYHENSWRMLRFETAGESHGECLVATLTGLPAGMPVSLDSINRELWRRQQGYGRGGRMKIETDRVEIVAGVRHSKTIGSPIAIIIRNNDWKNWTEALPVEDMDGAEDKRKPVTRPRPGHADLPGCIKYDFQDARYVLERASARETAARVAVGALAKTFLNEF